ncbi:hypothetical protein NP493_882g00003 [Ridgeia piscesae]|uniref:Uncharacterized protein n=1 Tax=Ridgeia piscesae TaxID=27915 RepID=A0AAD9KMV7_RIDPI|nr:hypothetical protein NP493_882g00003 [Ridgeia piscesae]
MDSLRSIWLPNNLLTEAGIQRLRDAASSTPQLWLGCLDWQRPVSEEALCPDDITFWQQRVNSLQTALSKLQARPQTTKHMQQDTGVIQHKLAKSKDSLRKVQSQRKSNE